MKAVVYTRFGPPKALHLQEVTKPVPKEIKALIKIHATTIVKENPGLRVSPGANGLLQPGRRFTGKSGPGGRAGRQIVHLCGTLLSKAPAYNGPQFPVDRGEGESDDDKELFMDPLVKICVLIGSCASIGFGAWHCFVPGLWNWYAYIDPQATELVIAVRAINLFFSFTLVLLGVVNILFVYSGRSNRYSIIVMLAATSLLWLLRVSLQMIYPQGSLYPGLQYGMLAVFMVIFLCYAVSLATILFETPLPNL